MRIKLLLFGKRLLGVILSTRAVILGFDATGGISVILLQKNTESAISRTASAICSSIMSTITKPKLPPVAMDTITQQIGNTPIVKLNRIPQSLGIEATVYAKLEFFNAGGSVKDRIALRMIEEAERSGRIKPGDTLIEPTSGNT